MQVQAQHLYAAMAPKGLIANSVVDGRDWFCL